MSARGLGSLAALALVVEPSDELLAQPQKKEPVLEVLEVVVVDAQMRQRLHHLRSAELIQQENILRN